MRTPPTRLSRAASISRATAPTGRPGVSEIRWARPSVCSMSASCSWRSRAATNAPDPSGAGSGADSQPRALRRSAVCCSWGSGGASAAASLPSIWVWACSVSQVALHSAWGSAGHVRAIRWSTHWSAPLRAAKPNAHLLPLDTQRRSCRPSSISAQSVFPVAVVVDGVQGAAMIHECRRHQGRLVPGGHHRVRAAAGWEVDDLAFTTAARIVPVEHLPSETAPLAQVSVGQLEAPGVLQASGSHRVEPGRCDEALNHRRRPGVVGGVEHGRPPGLTEGLVRERLEPEGPERLQEVGAGGSRTATMAPELWPGGSVRTMEPSGTCPCTLETSTSTLPSKNPRC